MLELRDESWRRILDVNLTGMFIATQEAGRVMAARGRGAIVLMASTNAFYPEAHTAPYSTSKAGLVGFVRSPASASASTASASTRSTPGSSTRACRSC